MDTLYASIKDDLLEKIRNNTYSEGQVIPSEVDLAKAYGVSRPTIRQALQILENEGYLDRRKRRGTIVARTKPDMEVDQDAVRGLRGVQSFEDEIRASGRAVRTMPILVKEEVVGPEVAAALHLPLDAMVYKIVRLRYVDDIPNVFMENYVPCSLYPGFIDGVDFSETRLYARMRDLGRPVKKVTRRLEVIKADASSATLLDVPIGDPLFYFHVIGMDAEGNAVEYSVSSYRGRDNSFEFTVSEPDA